MVNVQGTVPAPLNYAPPGYKPFPKSICTSVNHQVCHGIPGERVLKHGDIVNIDITVIKDGYHGDTSRMFYVGEPAIQARRLCEVTYECMWLGIRAVRPARTSATSAPRSRSTPRSTATRVVREFCGHGIGRKFHEEPQVLHYGSPAPACALEPGMTFTIEPMINAGKPAIRELADGWTIVTKDHSLSAQWEHTVLVTETGYEVLTVSAGAPPTPPPARGLRPHERRRPARRRRRWRESLRAGAPRTARGATCSEPRRPARAAARPAPRSSTARCASLWRDAASPRALRAGRRRAATAAASCFRCSDVDLLVLLPREPAAGGARAARAPGRQALGHRPGARPQRAHGARTASRRPAQDITVQTALLEARLPRRQPRAVPTSSRRRSARAARPAGVLQGQAARAGAAPREVPGQPPTASSPTSRRRPGGLRDLQVILWIARACGLGCALARAGGARGLLTADGGARSSRGTRRCLRTCASACTTSPAGARTASCSTTRPRSPTQCGCAATPARRASEQLMQRYYRTAKARHAAQHHPAAEPRGARCCPSRTPRRAPLNERFQVRGELLEARDREDLFEREPRAILESFLLLQQHPELKGMTAPTLRALWRARARIDARFRRDPATRALFLQILQQPRGIVHELRRMNQYDVLGRYLPAFGRIVGQMQHDLFHVYTVDQHILMVVRNLRRFTMVGVRARVPAVQPADGGFERRWLLYVAALFHDIAKGRGGDHSRARHARRAPLLPRATACRARTPTWSCSSSSTT